MSARKSAVRSPESIARADRQRLAAEEGVRAIAGVERQAIEVRKNMARMPCRARPRKLLMRLLRQPCRRQQLRSARSRGDSRI